MWPRRRRQFWRRGVPVRRCVLCHPGRVVRLSLILSSVPLSTRRKRSWFTPVVILLENRLVVLLVTQIILVVRRVPLLLVLLI